MADIKLESDYWETAGIRDRTQNKTQRQINASLQADITEIQSDIGDMDNLDTQATNLVGAANELKGSLNAKLIKLTATLNSSVTSATIASWSNQTGITENSFVVEAKFSNPSAILSNITVTKDTGSVVLTGTTGASAGTIELIMGNE